MTSFVRSHSDLLQEIREQAEALRSSASAYDSGKLWEAKRLATTVYILVHDGGRNNKSLLGKLGWKNSFPSTANKSTPLPLAVIEIDVKPQGRGMSFIPHLDSGVQCIVDIPFSRWYEEVVFCTGKLKLSRKNLIFTFRSQFGGAHVDSEITDEAFGWLLRDSPFRISTGPSVYRDSNNNILSPKDIEGLPALAEIDGPVPNGNFASMRQIAWEIDRKLASCGI